MAVFANCSVLLELKTLPVKEKKTLKSAITDNGGNICFVVNKQCSLVVTSDVSNLSSNRLRSIHKHQTPVVAVDYVYTCLDRGVLLPVDEFKLHISSSTVSAFSFLPIPSLNQVRKVPTTQAVAESHKAQDKPVDSVSRIQTVEPPEKRRNVLEKFRIYTESDCDLPTYPDHFQVAKYSVFEKINSNTWCVLELQSVKVEHGRQYRVVRYWNNDLLAKKAAVRDMLVFPPTSEDALEVYLVLRETLQNAGLQLRSNIPSQALDLGSGPLQQLLLEEKLNAGIISQDVGVFVELLWSEALGCLGSVLRVSIDKLSLNDVSRAEGLLLQAQRKLKGEKYSETSSLLEEVYTLLPHRAPEFPPSAKLLSQKLDLCQLLRDVLSVSEMSLRSPVPSCLGKYRALRCSIETVPRSSSEFQAVTALLQNSKVQIQQVLRVSRGVELQMFKRELGNIKPLLHSSSPSNFVGILSRGLLLPRVAVEHHGIERTDLGNLGSGIYFSDAVSTSLKYSRPSVVDGSRLLLVCDVALGRCRDVFKRDFTLTQPPEGHHSVHGVRRTPKVQSDFEEDEFVVYSSDQVQLKYVVQFSLDGEELKDFSPAIDTLAEPCLPSSDQVLCAEDDGLEVLKNPLEDVTAGLLDSSGQQLPLQAVHVKCKLIDLLSQVVIFQKYTNTNSVPIEAKYVFPLEESAAVCGFEAFINGKHVVGQVKEKETARKEYRQAVEKGHGAYLMDQDAPDVFTISVGNLPPGATVLIKVSFVSELIIKDGNVFFSLPGSVAPWQESAALNQTTQVTMEKVCVTDEAANTREFTLDMSVEMAYEICSVTCITHKVKIKQTKCKAVVSVLPGELMGAEGFQLSVTLSDVHLPRMWVENHPDKDSQACMLVFYPAFDNNSNSAHDEVVLLLDTSESMKGDSLRAAQRIALQVLKCLDQQTRLNIILFGTDHKEAFLSARPLVEARQEAERFVKRLSPVGGSTELWRPLRALSLLPPTHGVRNLLLLCDGHVQNPEVTLQLLKDNAQHSRLFTCGLSPTANRHMLRALAQAGGGAYEFFDSKTKHNWTEKVACQVERMRSPGCSSVSVKWQQFNPNAPVPLQAPKQIHALFNDCHTLVYGFVPHCTQATLLGNLSGQELRTMVSTSELQKTRGTLLHKLTARALIRDYEDGNLEADEAEHEGKKAELKSFIVELSKEFSILSQFTSFVAIEERDSEETEQGFTDVPKLIAEEDVDFLPYMSWVSPQESKDEEEETSSEETYDLYSCDTNLLMEKDECYDGQVTDGHTPSPEALELHLSDLLSNVVSCTGLSPPPHDILAPPPRIARLASPPTPASPPPPPPHHRLFRKCGSRRSVQHDLLPAPPPPPRRDRLALAVDYYRHPVASALRPSDPPEERGHKKEETSKMCKLMRRRFESSKTPLKLTSRDEMMESCNEWTEDECYDRHVTRGRTLFPKELHHSDMLSDYNPVSATPPSVPPPSVPPPSVPPPSVPPPSVLPPSALLLSAPPASAPPPSVPPPSVSPPSALLLSALPASAPPPSAPLPSVPSPVAFGSPARIVACGSSSLNLPLVHQSRAIFRQGSSFSSCGFSFGPNFTPLSTCLSPTPFTSAARSSPLALDLSSPSRDPGLSGFGSAPAPVFAHFKPKSLALSVSESEERHQIADKISKQAGLSRSRGGPTGRSFLESADSLNFFRAYRSPPLKPISYHPAPTWPKQKKSGRVFRREPPQPESHTKTLADPQTLKLKWTMIFQMQNSEGYWELSSDLGALINVDVDAFANVFLKNKGIDSLGVTARAVILKLVATLLVLQLMRVEELEEGKLLRTLFSLDDSQPRPERWEETQRAVRWVCWADRQYPSVYSRLEFGLSWESSTRQLLGHEVPPPFSPLSGVNLQRAAAPVMVH